MTSGFDILYFSSKFIPSGDRRPRHTQQFNNPLRTVQSNIGHTMRIASTFSDRKTAKAPVRPRSSVPEWHSLTSHAEVCQTILPKITRHEEARDVISTSPHRLRYHQAP